ncbi:hypothetical protein M427DRAFT_59208, partial [Gonapodya prolifera JEL478]
MEMEIHAGESHLLKQCTGNSSLGNCFSTNCISSTPATQENTLRCLSDKIGIQTRTGSGNSKELLELERTPLAKKQRTELELQRGQLEEQWKEQEQRGETNQAMWDLLVR